MKTKRIFDYDDRFLKFLDNCKNRNFKNNSTLESMKWKWCLDIGGAWYATFTDDESLIIAVTGIHPFRDGFRALFRGAQLETSPIKGLNRYQMQSWGVYDHLPLQIEFADGKNIYITTNIKNDASGRMNRIHRSFEIMSKGKMINHISDEIIFNVEQSIWKLNIERYFEIRNRINV